MTETDAEFVERVGPGLEQLNADGARLARLARRGAAVQWRPISEAPKDGAELLVSDPRGVVDNVILLSWFDGEYWRDGSGGRIYPTHFIPLTALGEPNE